MSAGERAAPPATSPARTTRGGAPLLLLLACALPHALRAAWPLAEFGGGATLLAARRLGLDGVAASPDDGPLLFERLLAGLLEATGGAARPLELITIALVLVTAWRLRSLGRALAGPWAGAAAALAWSLHPWVLHVQAFDRGLWAAPFAAWALERLAVTAEGRGARLPWPALLAVVLIDAPYSWPLPALTGAVLALRGRRPPAVACVLLIGALPWLGSLVGSWMLTGGAGPARPLNVFDVLASGPTGPGARLGSLAAHLDPFTALAVAAAAVFLVRRPRGWATRPVWLPAVLLALELLRAALRLPDAGATAMIGPALPAALLAGLALEAALGGSGAPLRNAAVAATALLMALVIVDVFGPRSGAVSPESPRRSVVRAWLTDRWRPAQVGYGLFGGRPRSHLAARVALLEAHSRADDVVGGAWAWEAAAADRPRWTPVADDAAVLWLEPLPADVSAEALAAAGWRRVPSPAWPEVAAWVRPAE